MFMYIYIHIYIYTHIYIHIYTYVHIYTYICIYVYVYMCVCVCVCVDKYIVEAYIPVRWNPTQRQEAQRRKGGPSRTLLVYRYRFGVVVMRYEWMY